MSIINNKKNFSFSFLTNMSIILICFSPAIHGNPDLKINSSDIHVDDCLHLNNNFIPILKNTLSQCNNSSTRNLIKSMIIMLEQKGEISSNDIKNIISDLQIKTIKIYYLKLIIGHSYGKFFCFPGFLFLHLFGFDWNGNNIHLPYIGPSFILLGEGNIEILRIGKNIKSNYYLSIGFLGCIKYYQFEHYSEVIYGGISHLTIIIPDK